jgi:apolipoprotein N-acyltransferase
MVPMALVLALGMIVHIVGDQRIRAAEFESGPSVAGIQVSTSPRVRRALGSVLSWFEHYRVWAEHPRRFEAPDLMVISETALRGIELPERSLANVLMSPMGIGLRGNFGDILPRGEGTATVLGYLERLPADLTAGDRDNNDDGLVEHNSAAIVTIPRGGVLVRETPQLVANYRKRVCVPLGEVIPGPQSYPGRDWLKQQVLDAGGFIPDVTPGKEWVVGEVNLAGTTRRIGLNICYEMVFPEAFRAQVQRDADFIVNVSNDSWYGTSCELDLVHVQARFRAVESGRSVFRVSNGGISTSVDPVGRYRETVKAGEDRKGVEGVLRDRVPIAKGQTLWIRFGDGAIGGLLGLLLLLVPAFSYWLRKSRGL